MTAQARYDFISGSLERAGMRLRLLTALVVTLAILAGASPGFAGSQLDWELAAFLRSYLGPDAPATAPQDATRYTVAWSDLNGDGYPEAIVYVSGGGRCGSGGCPLLVLQRERTGFVLRARTTITWPPVSVLDTKSHDWRDLVVSVSGGGVTSHRAVLSFNGQRYPSNPTVPPARPLGRGWAGRVLIKSDENGALLYLPHR